MKKVVILNLQSNSIMEDFMEWLGSNIGKVLGVVFFIYIVIHGIKEQQNISEGAIKLLPMITKYFNVTLYIITFFLNNKVAGGIYSSNYKL